MCPPDEKIIKISLDILQRLNALTSEEDLTPLGYHLARLPMDPRSGKMILFGAIFSCLDPILTVAASLSFKDAFLIPMGEEEHVNQCKIELAANSGSDHLMFAKAMKGWEEAKLEGCAESFCKDNFLSENTLQMLVNLKKQFTECLSRLGFLQKSDPKDVEYNLNSSNELLLKAVICAGLYPNIAKVVSKEVNRNLSKTITAQSEDGLKVSLHPKSVNAFDEKIKSDWLGYHLKLKSGSGTIYLHDTTTVSPYSLILFGNKLELGHMEGSELVTLDDWIVFQCCQKTADLFQELRKEMSSLLQRKMSAPSVSDWKSDSREAVVLKGITKLLSFEGISRDFELGQDEHSAGFSSEKTASIVKLNLNLKQDKK